MSGRAAIEKTLEDDGQTKLHYLKVALAVGSIISIPTMIAFSFIATVTIKIPNYWAVNVLACLSACLASIGWAFRKRELLIREAVGFWNVEMERRRVQADKDRADATQRAALAARQAEQERIADAERARLRRAWEREEAVRKAAEELAGLENTVRVLWADFQATHNFTGETPADQMRERFGAELRKRLSKADLDRLNGTKSSDVSRLVAGRGQA